MRKIAWLALLLCVFMTMNVFGGAANEVKSTEGSAEKVVFWNDKLNDVVQAQVILKPWQESYGGTIENNPYADNAAYRTAVSQSIESSSAPNLFTWWSGAQLESLATSGKLMELDDVWKDIVAMGVSEDIKTALSFNGHAYAVPFSVLNTVMLYNTEAFKKAGISKTPATFDEFLVACEKLKSVGITPIGHRNNSWASFVWFQAIIAAYDPALYLGICDGSIAYDDPQMFKAMTVWKNMLDKGYFAEPVLDTDNFRRFAQSGVGMILDGQHQVPKLSNDYGLVSGEGLDAFVLPSMSGNKDVLFFEVSPMVAPKAAKNPEATKEMIKAFYTEATQAATLEARGILLISSIPVEDPTLSKINAMTSHSDKYLSVLRFYENTPAGLRDFVITEMSKFMSGVATVEGTLSACAKEAVKYF
jgi:multiple sugar transport system substrate-binding protein